MRVVNFEQGSPDWAVWRAAGLGASDAVAVMGESPYCTREQLMREKLGLAVRENIYAMRRGNRLEPLARELYAMARLCAGGRVEPCCVVSAEHDWLRASLDGLAVEVDTHGEVAAEWVVEVKCWGWQKHDLCLAGIAPKEVVGQIQHQLLVTGLESADLVSYSDNVRFDAGDRLAVVPVRVDREYRERLVEELHRFWDEFLACRAELVASKVGAL